jgi:peptidoglycan/xylan/chitin deacetylase (PgdA/CDA1 family)
MRRLRFARALGVLVAIGGLLASLSGGVVSMAASGATGPSGATGATGATGSTGPSGRPAPPVLYRATGCVRTGPAVAYFHGPRRKVIAIGFDDGPWPDTPAFLSMLEAHHINATFFMIGEQVTARYQSVLERELRDGDALGDHTYTHPDLVRSGNVASQLQRTIQAIRGLSGYTPCVFRPPYGDFDQSVVATAKSLGLATVLWNVDPTDWARPGVGAIEQRVLAQVQPGSIIISHDGGGPRQETLSAYPQIIDTLQARGYRFETIPQLLGFHTIYERCVQECHGAGVKGPLPAGSVVTNGG